MQTIIAPSILSCDFSCLYEECQRLISAGSDWLHIDIMDGHFVPNLTLGPPIIKCLNNKFKGSIFFDCHCMVSNPKQWIEPLAKAGANQMTVTLFFYFGCTVGDIKEILLKIKEAGMNAALAFSPKTKIDESILNLLMENPFDMVLIMTVGDKHFKLMIEPGFGGQTFMEDMMPKVKLLRNSFPNLNIQVDGGISCDNVHIAAQAGANIIVSGTGIVTQDNQQKAIQQMREIVDKYKH